MPNEIYEAAEFWSTTTCGVLSCLVDILQIKIKHSGLPSANDISMEMKMPQAVE